jgi:hypothetical protein
VQLRLRVLQPGARLPLRGTLGECHALRGELVAHDCRTLLEPVAQQESPPLAENLNTPDHVASHRTSYVHGNICMVHASNINRKHAQTNHTHTTASIMHLQHRPENNTL